ncbi:MAG TPA: hypothetical protein PLJ75_13105, partial [Spirochaetota bacterium]|nr:hypothetical protein [Spirochaetota bacterium]
MESCGINIGSTSVKVVLCNNNEIQKFCVLPHEGDVPGTLGKIVAGIRIPDNAKAIVTGNEGRFMINLPRVIESVCIEEVLRHLVVDPVAVVSMGGEDLVVYTIGEDKKIKTSF